MDWMMIEQRELTIDDYLGMLRRRLKVIVIPAILMPVAGLLLSYAFAPKYTSTSLLLVEEQKVPEGYVKPVVTEDITTRLATMQQQVLSRNRLQPMIERLGLTKKGKNGDQVVDDIRQNFSIEPVVPGTLKKRSDENGTEVPAFNVNYTADNAHDAQQICTELTSMLLEEDLKGREQVAQSTTDFLARQLEEAKRNLDDQDRKLADFKKHYIGQLPGDEDNNMKILMGLNSQLEANTQALNRSQQDKAYTESLLAQQLSSWKTSQSANNPDSLEQQLAQLQSQLLSLQARYTDDHPDVIKTKADIAEVQKKLDQVNASTGPSTAGSDKASPSEPPEIRQLRLQVHQYQAALAEATRHQKELQDQIASYQGRLALSPEVEERYKALTRDYDTAQKFYNDLLAKKSESEMQTDMERRQQGARMRLLNPANLPENPSFPNRWEFSGGGLAAGLGLGLTLALWMEMRDKSIRTEQDVIAVLELPMLVAVPWLGTPAKNGYGRIASSTKPVEPEKKKETVEV